MEKGGKRREDGINKHGKHGTSVAVVIMKPFPGPGTDNTLQWIREKRPPVGHCILAVTQATRKTTSFSLASPEFSLAVSLPLSLRVSPSPSLYLYLSLSPSLSAVRKQRMGSMG